ncbi:MAG: aspartate kinase [Candidatus Kapaibacteriales bacterium]
MGIKVLKFGGTSLASHSEFERVLQIIQSQIGNDKLIVVLSACAGITEKLLQLAKSYNKNKLSDKDEILNFIEQHHIQIATKKIEDPKLLTDAIHTIENFIKSINLLLEGVIILEEVTPKVTDQILSYGELLSSHLFYYYTKSKNLNSTILDAREIIITDGVHLNAVPDLKAIERNSIKIHKLLQNFDLVITQGFIGSWSKETTTLGRGGSDLSASLFAYSTDADEVQIWTDVNGILSADPKFVKNPITIPLMSFDEVVELSFWGAKVLHPESIKPAMLKNIPVKILNTFEPSNEGTLVVDKIEEFVFVHDNKTPKIHSITLTENCYLLKKRLNPFSKPLIHFYELLNHPFQKILHFNGNQNYFKAIVNVTHNEHQLMQMLKEEEISYRLIDVITLCGINLHKPNHSIYSKLMRIIYELKPFPVHQIIFRSSDFSIIFAIQREKGKEIIDVLHKIITN